MSSRELIQKYSHRGANRLRACVSEEAILLVQPLNNLVKREETGQIPNRKQDDKAQRLLCLNINDLPHPSRATLTFQHYFPCQKDKCSGLSTTEIEAQLCCLFIYIRQMWYLLVDVLCITRQQVGMVLWGQEWVFFHYPSFYLGLRIQATMTRVRAKHLEEENSFHCLIPLPNVSDFVYTVDGQGSYPKQSS